MQIAVSVGVAATLIVRRRVPAERSGLQARWAAPATGLSAGALVTSTNTSGPPLLLYMLGRGDEPARVRDTLTVMQLGLSVIGAVALVVTGTSDAVPSAGLVAAFVPLVLLAQLAGRPLFAGLAARGHVRARAQRDAAGRRRRGARHRDAVEPQSTRVKW